MSRIVLFAHSLKKVVQVGRHLKRMMEIMHLVHLLIWLFELLKTVHEHFVIPLLKPFVVDQGTQVAQIIIEKLLA